MASQQLFPDLFVTSGFDAVLAAEFVLEVGEGVWGLVSVGFRGGFGS